MKTNRCIENLLKLIDLLQRNSTTDNYLDEGCAKPYLGPSCTTICYNTRPVRLYSKNNDLITGTYLDSNNQMQTTSIFRIQKVNKGCVTLLLLSANDNGTYSSTNTYITVRVCCICAVRCLPDTIVDCV